MLYQLLGQGRRDHRAGKEYLVHRVRLELQERRDHRVGRGHKDGKDHKAGKEYLVRRVRLELQERRGHRVGRDHRDRDLLPVDLTIFPVVGQRTRILLLIFGIVLLPKQ